MKTRAAVLEAVGLDSPFATSTPISIEDLDLAGPGPGEVLVRMEAAGVCHSDLSRLTGDRAARVPLVLGHEACGIVEAIGDDVESIVVGDKVTMTFMPRCGECAACLAPTWRLCERGLVANADGTLLGGARRFSKDGVAIDHHGGVSAFSEYIVADQHSAVAIPNEIPSGVGALLGCAVLTGGGAVINAGRLEPGQSVAIVGMGGVGLAAALVAVGAGASSVTAIDTNPDKLQTALAVAASDAMTSSEAALSGRRFDLVIECVGHPAALSTAIALTDVGGRTVTIGLPRPGTKIELDPLALVLDARSVIGSYMGSGVPSDDILHYAQMYLAGKLELEKLITGTTTLDNLNTAMDRLHDGKEIRQIVTFGTVGEARA